MVNAVSQGAKAVEGAAGQAVQGAEGMLDDAVDQAVKKANDVWNEVQPALDQAAKEATNTWNKVQPVLDQAAKGAQDAFKDAAKAVEGLGREDNRNLWDDAVDWTEDQAWNAVKCGLLGPLCVLVRMDQGKSEILGNTSCSTDSNTQMG